MWSAYIFGQSNCIFLPYKKYRLPFLILKHSIAFACVPRIIVLDMHDVQNEHLKAKTHAEIFLKRELWGFFVIQRVSVFMWIMAKKNNFLHVSWQHSKKSEWKTEVCRFHKQQQNKDAWFRIKEFTLYSWFCVFKENIFYFLNIFLNLPHSRYFEDNR